MKPTTNNLEQLTQKIITAVPSILIASGGACSDYYRDITLEDVLIALSTPYLNSGQYLIEKGKFIFIDEEGEYVCEWLLNTPLHLQSDETISAINKLIK